MPQPIDAQSLDFMPPAFPWAVAPELQHHGRDEDDDAGDDEDDADEDGDDDEDDDEDERTPEQLRADLAAAKKRLERVNAEAKRRRLAAKEEREKAAKPPVKKSDDGDDDIDARIAAAKAEATTAADSRIKRVSATSALEKAGVAEDRAARALKLLDLDDLGLDDDGVIGLDDAIESLREDFPELFEKRRRARRSGADGNDRDGNDDRGPKDAKSASQRQAELLLGKK